MFSAAAAMTDTRQADEDESEWDRGWVVGGACCVVTWSKQGVGGVVMGVCEEKGWGRRSLSNGWCGT